MREFARQYRRGAARLRPGFVGVDAQTAGEHAAGESRRHFRSSKLRWPIEIEPVPLPEGRVPLPEGRVPEGRVPGRIRAETLGVSLGGTFVVCDEPFAVDTDLHLWLYPPDPSPRGPRVLRLLARVRWVSETPGPNPNELPRGFGVAFRALTPTDEIALHGSFSRSAKGDMRR